MIIALKSDSIHNLIADTFMPSPMLSWPLSRKVVPRSPHLSKGHRHRPVHLYSADSSLPPTENGLSKSQTPGVIFEVVTSPLSAASISSILFPDCKTWNVMTNNANNKIKKTCCKRKRGNGLNKDCDNGEKQTRQRERDIWPAAGEYSCCSREYRDSPRKIQFLIPSQYYFVNYSIRICRCKEIW